MRTVNGKNVLLFGPEWSMFELAELFGKRGYQLKRHESGAIEIVKKPVTPKVVPIRQARGIELAVIRNQEQPKPKQRVPFLSAMFPFQLPEHDGPGAA